MSSEKLSAAKEQLNRILGFFPRVDAKASWLFATNAALLGVASANIHLSDFPIWYITLPASATALMLIASMYFLYRCSFPSLDGGSGSLYYFREIAGRTEANFITEFTDANDSQSTKDVLGQVWRNSEILTIKFNSIKIAFILTALSLIPWCWFLIVVSVAHAQVPTIH